MTTQARDTSITNPFISRTFDVGDTAWIPTGEYQAGYKLHQEVTVTSTSRDLTVKIIHST